MHKMSTSVYSQHAHSHEASTPTGPLSPPNSVSNDSESSLNQDATTTGSSSSSSASTSPSPSSSMCTSATTATTTSTSTTTTTVSSARKTMTPSASSSSSWSRVSWTEPAELTLKLQSSLRPVRCPRDDPSNSSSQFVEAMSEDLAEWLNALYPGLDLSPDNFFERLETGEILCNHANTVTMMGRKLHSPANNDDNNNQDDNQDDELCASLRRKMSMQTGTPTPRPRARQLASKLSASKSFSSLTFAHCQAQQQPQPQSMRPQGGQKGPLDWCSVPPIHFRPRVRAGTFFARDNICQFIKWTRSLGIHECLLFETDDLVERKNERSFILCLLEVARIGFRVGMATPTLIQFEQEIDRELEQSTSEHSTDEGYSDYQDHVHDHEDQNDLDKPRPQDQASRIPTRQQATPSVEPQEFQDEDEDLDYGPKPQIITNDLLSLHERVSCTFMREFY